MYLLSPEHWLRQPIGARVNLGNPLTRGICFAWNALNHRHEAITGRRAEINNTANKASTSGKFGPLRSIKASTGQNNLDWDYGFMQTSDGAGTGAFTMAVLANPLVGTGAVQHLFVQKNDAAGSPYNQAILCADANLTASYSSGRCCFFMYDTGNSGVEAVAAYTSGEWTLFGGGILEASGTNRTFRLMVNDQFFTSSVIQRDCYRNSRHTAIGSRGNGTTEAASCEFGLAVMWNRALSNAEWREFYSNPWQIFEPVATRRHFLLTNAAGGSAYTLTAEAGVYNLTGAAASTLFNRLLAAEQAVYTLTGMDVTLSKGLRLTAESGAYVLSGTAAAPLHNRKLSADTGSYALTGESAGVLRGFTLTPESGGYSISGMDVGLQRTYRLPTDTGTYSVSGQAVDVRFNRKLAALGGTYTVSGMDATLTHGVPGAFVLNAEAGSYTLSGSEAALVHGGTGGAGQRRLHRKGDGRVNIFGRS